MLIFLEEFFPMILKLLQMVAFLLSVIVGVIFLVYFERRVIGLMQQRMGPNVVGPFGLLQSVADALKLLLKETIIPAQSNKFLFLFSPLLVLFLSLTTWAVMPVAEDWVIADINIGVLFVFAISSLSVYGILMAGWSSNSRYAFLGALRTSAQMISYEVSMGLIILSVLMSAGSLNLTEIVLAQKDLGLWYVVPHFPMFIMFFISALAETNRHPFDLPEAETELVSGYNVEYSSIFFAFFFLGEYTAMILMSGFITTLFLGGWLPLFGIDFIPGFFWFFLKVLFLLFVFIWVRVALPRYRYDQLMRIGWKVFLPGSLIWFVCTAFYLQFGTRIFNLFL